jgi:hypothetical protein
MLVALGNHTIDRRLQFPSAPAHRLRPNLDWPWIASRLAAAPQRCGIYRARTAQKFASFVNVEKFVHRALRCIGLQSKNAKCGVYYGKSPKGRLLNFYSKFFLPFLFPAQPAKITLLERTGILTLPSAAAHHPAAPMGGLNPHRGAVL